VLQAAGYAVHVPQRPAGQSGHLCCGRTYLSTGMVDEAKARARELIDVLLPFAQRDIAIVGLEPSCLLTLRDEALALGLGDKAVAVSKQALLFEEFIAREAKAGRFDVAFTRVESPMLVHGHCHQKAFAAVAPILDVLRLVPGAHRGRLGRSVILFGLFVVLVAVRALVGARAGQSIATGLANAESLLALLLVVHLGALFVFDFGRAAFERDDLDRYRQSG
jgi:hypothetical protein